MRINNLRHLVIATALLVTPLGLTRPGDRKVFLVAVLAVSCVFVAATAALLLTGPNRNTARSPRTEDVPTGPSANAPGRGPDPPRA